MAADAIDVALSSHRMPRFKHRILAMKLNVPTAVAEDTRMEPLSFARFAPLSQCRLGWKHRRNREITCRL